MDHGIRIGERREVRAWSSLLWSRSAGWRRWATFTTLSYEVDQYGAGYLELVEYPPWWKFWAPSVRVLASIPGSWEYTIAPDDDVAISDQGDS